MITYAIQMLLTTLSAVVSFQSKNPMQVLMSILIMSVMFMNMTSSLTGKTWLPMIIIMLLLGGIFVMFSVVSSLQPNTGKKKTKFSKKTLIISISLIMTLQLCPSVLDYQILHMSSMLTYSPNYAIMMGIVLLYFFLFIFLISSQKTTMRTYQCYNSAIL